ncbi:hypothetical protein [Paenibacillus sp. PL91]|nr:hypothetical protein [Paenibacillus sp. PL91]
MKVKKIVPFSPKPVPLKDKYQKDIIEERREKRSAWLKKIRQKEQ